jgi:hypothetical protein
VLFGKLGTTHNTTPHTLSFAHILLPPTNTSLVVTFCFGKLSKLIFPLTTLPSFRDIAKDQRGKEMKRELKETIAKGRLGERRGIRKRRRRKKFESLFPTSKRQKRKPKRNAWGKATPLSLNEKREENTNTTKFSCLVSRFFLLFHTHASLSRPRYKTSLSFSRC